MTPKKRATAKKLVRPVEELVECPRCEGFGEEPGAPTDVELGEPLCTECHGHRQVSVKQAKQYAEDME
jgi:DnaJ-class molecular chaperone